MISTNLYIWEVYSHIALKVLKEQVKFDKVLSESYFAVKLLHLRCVVGLLSLMTIFLEALTCPYHY